MNAGVAVWTRTTRIDSFSVIPLAMNGSGLVVYFEACRAALSRRAEGSP